MTKWQLFTATLLLVICLCGCGQQSALQEATGANAVQGRAIDEVLTQQGIAYELVNEANYNRPATPIPADCTVYNLIDADGNNYFMVLNSEKKVVTLLNSDETVIISSVPEAADD